MTSCSRNFMKLSRSIYTSATRKVPQTQCSRYFSLISKSGSTGTSNHITRQYTVFNKTSRRVPPYIATCRSSHHQTDGDNDLVRFLKDEIAFEEENVKNVPKLKHFNMQMDGTVVLLRRDFNGENVEVKFNCNDSLNVDDADGESVAEEAASEDDDISDIVSYPSFTVTITKPSGKTLLFNCNCNTGINDDDDVEGDPEEEQYDLLRFDSVQVFNSDVDNDKGKIYEAETENMDGELYSMLVNTLLERGINGTFVNELIDLSTSVEHRHYLTFLKSLNDFMRES